MGARLCTLHHQREEFSSDDFPLQRSKSLRELWKQELTGCEEKKKKKKKKKLNEEQRKRAMANRPLGEWLRSSPSFSQEFMSNSGTWSQRNSPKVCPVDCYLHLQPMQLGDDEEQSVSMSKAYQENDKPAKRKVSFRLPEEADTHFIYKDSPATSENNSDGKL